MKDILEEIVANKRCELEQWRQFIPMKQLFGIIEYEGAMNREIPSMKQALLDSSTGVIAEFKRKSPSKGWIKQDGKAREIPLSYERNGAAALSIHTDNAYFGGYDEFIQEARATGVSLPILYNNFVIDEYQLFQAKHAGASAILLMAAILTKEQCHSLISLAHQLKMEVLLEMHNIEELEYIECEPDMYGINNRILGSFATDVEKSFKMAEMLPEDDVKVSAGGIRHSEVVRDLREIGYKGFLIGAYFMKEENPGEALKRFIENINN